MRLSNRQRQALFAALEEVGLPAGSEVYLFGSRVDDSARGGDIDLLIVGPVDDAYDLELSIKRAYRKRVDERLDVVVLNTLKPDPDTELFVKTLDTERIA